METREPISATKSFQCTFCQKSCSPKSNLEKHIQAKHVEDKLKSYSCKTCLQNNQHAKSFTTQKLLNKHMRQIHEPPRYKCDVCFKTFNDSSYLWRHRRIHLSSFGKKHQCEYCSRSCNSKAVLQTHLFYVHKKKTEGLNYFKCEFCFLEFVSIYLLERHIVKKHVVDKAFECPVCVKTFMDQNTLDKHMKRHDPQIKYLCDICSKGFKRKDTLMKHLRLEHLKLFYCNKCFRSFVNNSEFVEHSDPITGSKLKSKVECQICGASFNSQCNLDIHTNCHLNEINLQKAEEINKNTADTKPVMVTKPELITEKIKCEFQCELCLKSLGSGAYLAAHRKRVHPNAEWTCSVEQCSKTFKGFSQLREHKLTHLAGEAKQFVCQVCPKSFHSLKYLRRHEKTHAQDKQYKCTKCPKSYVLPNYLRDHIANKHGGPKPFKCPVLNCGKSCANSSFLNRHLVAHQSERMFKCATCAQNFKTRQYLETHRRRVHSDEFQRQRQELNFTNSQFADAAVATESSIMLTKT